MPATIRELPDTPDGWRDDAACAVDQVDVEMFFSTDEASVSTAKQLCASCTVSDICLELAMAARSRDGIFGGMTGKERRSLRRRRRKAKKEAAKAA